MLAQVLQSVKRPSVDIAFGGDTKHQDRAELIEAFLQGSSDNIILQALRFRGAGMTKAELVPVAQCLNWSHPLMVVELDLANNRMGVTGARELATTLRRNRTLFSLDVSDNMLGSDGCKVLLEAIKDHPVLNRLSMGGNSMRAEGTTVFKDVLATNKKLRRLDLPGNKLGPKGAAHVARALAVNHGLHRVDLSDNGIRVAGFVELAQALHENNSLLRLFLTGNVIGGPVTEAALIQLLRANKTLVLIGITGTGIVLTPELEQALALSFTLRSLGGKVSSPAVSEVFARNLASRIALEKAVEGGDIEAVKRLLPQAPLGYFERKTLLHHAVIGGPAVMRLLFQHPTIASQANSKDTTGQGPLHQAAIHGSVDAAHLLLHHGAICSLRDNAGKTPADLTKDEAFKRLMDAETSFVVAFRQRNVDPVGSGDYYINSSGLKSPLQAWQSDRPVTVGSRFPHNPAKPQEIEPSHPFKFMEAQVAPKERRGGWFVHLLLFLFCCVYDTCARVSLLARLKLSLDTIQKLRDVIVFCIMIAWMYELLEIPFRWAFAPNPIPGGYWALALFMDLVFITYFFWQLAGHRQSWDPDSDSSEFAWLWSHSSELDSKADAPKQGQVTVGVAPR